MLDLPRSCNPFILSIMSYQFLQLPIHLQFTYIVKSGLHCNLHFQKQHIEFIFLCLSGTNSHLLSFLYLCLFSIYFYMKIFCVCISCYFYFKIMLILYTLKQICTLSSLSLGFYLDYIFDFRIMLILYTLKFLKKGVLDIIIIIFCLKKITGIYFIRIWVLYVWSDEQTKKVIPLFVWYFLDLICYHENGLGFWLFQPTFSYKCGTCVANMKFFSTNIFFLTLWTIFDRGLWFYSNLRMVGCTNHICSCYWNEIARKSNSKSKCGPTTLLNYPLK